MAGTMWSLNLLAQISWGFLILPVYSLIFLVIVKKPKTFKSTFFRVFLWMSATNICVYSIRYVASRLPLATCQTCELAPLLTSSSGYWLNIAVAFQWHAAIFQALLTTVINIDRYLVLMSINYPRLEDVWRRYYPLAIAVAGLLPFPISWEFLRGGDAYFSYIRQWDRFEAIVPNTNPYVTVYGTLILSLGSTVINVALDLIIIFQFAKGSLKLSNWRSNSELRLFIFCLFEGLLQVLAAVSAEVQVLLRGFIPELQGSSPLSTSIFLHLGDFSVTAGAFALLLACKNLRKEILSLFGFRSLEKIQPVSSTMISMPTFPPSGQGA